MSTDGVYYPAYTPGMGSRPRLQSVHPFRNLMMSGTHMNGAWAGGESGHSGYGADSADYDYHSGPAAHMPSGGSFYHATADTGYGVPAAPNPPVKIPSLGGKKGGGGKKGSGSTTVTALTLLSFFFFVNLLQNCIKEHMDSMNPTVMVMTTNVRRNRFNKMGEMNSREQNAGVSSSSSFNGIGGNLVMQPADMVASAAANSAAVMEATKPGLNLESPYSGVTGSVNKPLDYQQQQQLPIGQPPPAPVYHTNKPEPEVHYTRPYYDPHQPDAYEPQQHYPQQTQYNAQPQHPPIYTNHTVYQQPPTYIGSHEQPLPNNYPQSGYPYPPQPTPSHPPYQGSYHYQPTSAPAAPHAPQYSTPRNPFYEHQQPPSSPHIYKGHQEKPQSYNDNDSRYSHRYEMTSLQHKPQNPVPWSSYSSSVMSGPFRRASIVAVSPSPKWVSVPANVDDHTDFGTEEEREESSDGTGRSNRYSESYYGK